MLSIIPGQNGDRLLDAKSLARRRGAFAWRRGQRAAYTASAGWGKFLVVDPVVHVESRERLVQLGLRFVSMVQY